MNFLIRLNGIAAKKKSVENVENIKNLSALRYARVTRKTQRIPKILRACNGPPLPSAWDEELHPNRFIQQYLAKEGRISNLRSKKAYTKTNSHCDSNLEGFG